MDPQAHSAPVRESVQVSSKVGTEDTKKGQKTFILFLLLFIILLWGVSVFLGYKFGKSNCECPECKEVDASDSDTEDEENMYFCTTDEDCMIVQDGCCACTEGGKNTAINSDYKAAWDDKILEDCGVDSGCPEVISDDWTCAEDVIAKCVDGKCKLEQPEVLTKKCTYEDNVRVISFDIPQDWGCKVVEASETSVDATTITSDLIRLQVAFPFVTPCDPSNCDTEIIYSNDVVFVTKYIGKNSDGSVYIETRGEFKDEDHNDISIMLGKPDPNERDMTSAEMEELKQVLDTIVITKK